MLTCAVTWTFIVQLRSFVHHDCTFALSKGLSSTPMNAVPHKIIAVAPIRICDIGGWTDTWFAEHGNVFNISVSPFVEVQILTKPREALTGTITLRADNFGYVGQLDPTSTGIAHVTVFDMFNTRSLWYSSTSCCSHFKHATTNHSRH